MREKQERREIKRERKGRERCLLGVFVMGRRAKAKLRMTTVISDNYDNDTPGTFNHLAVSCPAAMARMPANF